MLYHTRSPWYYMRHSHDTKWSLSDMICHLTKDGMFLHMYFVLRSCITALFLTWIMNCSIQPVSRMVLVNIWNVNCARATAFIFDKRRWSCESVKVWDRKCLDLRGTMQFPASFVPCLHERCQIPSMSLVRTHMKSVNKASNLCTFPSIRQKTLYSLWKIIWQWFSLWWPELSSPWLSCTGRWKCCHGRPLYQIYILNSG